MDDTDIIFVARIVYIILLVNYKSIAASGWWWLRGGRIVWCGEVGIGRWYSSINSSSPSKHIFRA